MVPVTIYKLLLHDNGIGPVRFYTSVQWTTSMGLDSCPKNARLVGSELWALTRWLIIMLAQLHQIIRIRSPNSIVTASWNLSHLTFHIFIVARKTLCYIIVYDALIYIYIVAQKTLCYIIVSRASVYTFVLYVVQYKHCSIIM